MAQATSTLTDDLLPLISTLAYPVSLEDPLSDIEPDVSPLSELAAVEIVSKPVLLASVFHLELLPTALYPTLLKAAVLWGFESSIRFLIRHWPFAYIRLRDIVPLPILRSPLALVYYEAALSRLKLGIRLTTSLTRALLDCLATLNASQSKLQFIDLSGFPTAEVVACYAAVQCQLVNTDVQRQEMVKNFNELVSLMKKTEAEKEENTPSDEGGAENIPPPKEFELLEEKFTTPCALVVDMTLCHLNRVDDVMNALLWSRTPACRFRLIMSALNLQGLGFDIITRILECTIKSELKCLDVAYNALGGQTVVLMASLNSSYSNLSRLDLSSNNLNLSSLNSRAESAEFFGQSLASLPALQHLSLSKNRLTLSLEVILSHLPNNLITLRLAGCALRAEDLEYLALRSKHGQQYLDLSENNLGEAVTWGHVVALLKQRGSKLYSLELARCFIGDDELAEIIRLDGATTWLRSLRFLNLARNIIITRFLRQFVATVRYPDSPRCVLYLPCPFDCREREPQEGDEEGTTAGSIDHDMAAHGAIKILAPSNVKICFSGQGY